MTLCSNEQLAVWQKTVKAYQGNVLFTGTGKTRIKQFGKVFLNGDNIST
jgi:hypothetical protein